MCQRRPRKHPKIINFVLFYAMRVHFRKAPGRPSHLKPKEIIGKLIVFQSMFRLTTFSRQAYEGGVLIWLQEPASL